MDVWAEYARLRDQEGWTQQKIADAKGVAKSVVSERLKFHNLPDRVKRNVRPGLLTEGHLQSISVVVLMSELSSWLTTEGAWAELAELVVKGIGKNGDKSVKATRGEG